jgi:hypothetical protein
VNKVYGPSNWVVFFTIVAHTITVVVPLINYISIDNKYWIYARRKVKKFYRKVTKQPPCDTTAPIQLHVQQRHDLESDIAIASPTVILPELSIESLERTLADPEMMNLLQDLAIRDFSCENLLFYEKYLQLEEKFKKELVANRHFEHIRPHSVSVSKSWIQSWSKKSPLIPKITGNDSDNNSTDEDKQNCLSLEQFMSIPIPFKLYPDFMRFYETFIREGSPTQVNISYRARHAIDRVFCNIYKKNPDLNPNAEGESSARPMDSIFCNDEDEEARREQEEAIECSKNNRKPKANSVDDALEQQEPVTLLDFNMFEMARVEVCWNIFNSVYPKLVDMYNNSSNSTTIDSCSNDT